MPITSDVPMMPAQPIDVVAISHDVLTNLGSRLAYYRGRREMTLAQVAKILHTTATVLARWEADDMTSASYTQLLAALDWITSAQ